MASAETREYLRTVLSLDVDVSADTIIRRRAEFLQGEPALLEAEAAGDDDCELETIFRRRLRQLRGEFWNLPTEKLNQQLEQLQQVKHPPTVTAARHLARVAPHREALARLNSQPKANHVFLDALKRVLIAPAAEASAVREKQLGWMRPEQNAYHARARLAIQQTIKIIRRESPEVFELEANWLTELAQFNPVEEKENDLADQVVGVGLLVMAIGTIYVIYCIVLWIFS